MKNKGITYPITKLVFSKYYLQWWNIWHLKCCSAPLLRKNLRSLRLGFSRPTSCAIKLVSKAEETLTLPSKMGRLTFLCRCCAYVLFPIICLSSLLKATPYILNFKVFTFLCIKANKTFKYLTDFAGPRVLKICL